MITVILSYLLLGAKRFSDVGIYKAKFLLPYMSGAVLSNIISPIDFRNSLVLFVVNEKFRSAWLEIEPFLMDKKLNYKVMFIGSSNGQAHTVELGLIHLFNEGFNTNCPLFIFNGDTITHEKDFSYMISIFDNGVDGIIEYFESYGSVVLRTYLGVDYSQPWNVGFVNPKWIDKSPIKINECKGLGAN